MLQRAGIDRAPALAVTAADLVAAEAAVRIARQLNPALDIVTRSAAEPEVETLRQAGANEVVQPEFEAGLEFVRHLLRDHGLPAPEAAYLLERRRADFYRLVGPDAPGRPSPPTLLPREGEGSTVRDQRPADHPRSV